MYFLGTLEKILEGTPKVESISENKKAPASKPDIKSDYKAVEKNSALKKTYDKPYVKGEYKKPYEKNSGFNQSKPFVRSQTNNAYTEGVDKSTEQKPKKIANNCYGVYVRDGDTFEAMYNSKRVCFRLAGIDCPEVNKPFSQAASEFLKSKVLRKVVYLEFKGQDVYNREIVEAFEDKEMKISINKQLLEEGLATSEKYRNKEGDLTHNIIERIGNKIAEVSADFNDRGMWGDTPVTKVEPLKVVDHNMKEIVPSVVQTPFKRKFPK